MNRPRKDGGPRTPTPGKHWRGGTTGRVVDLCVSEAHRSCGIATSLLAEITTYAQRCAVDEFRSTPAEGYLRRICSVTVVVWVSVPAVPVIESVKVPVFVVPVV